MNKVINNKGEVKSFDGTMLYYEKDIVDNPEAIIIIVHGFAEHLGRYEYIKDKLNEFNYSIYRFDNRGHGRSGGIRGYVNSYLDFLYDLDIFVDMAIKENPKTQVYILGHSMGGFITSAYGIKYKDKINGQILSGAVTMITDKVSGIKGVFFKGLNKIIPKKRVKVSIPNLVNYLSHDENVVNDYINDPLNLKDATLKLYVEFLIKGPNWIKDNIKEYDYPCLILHGGNDKIVTKKASEYFYKNINSKDKLLKVYDGLYHEIFNEYLKDEIIDDINKWIKNRKNIQ